MQFEVRKTDPTPPFGWQTSSNMATKLDIRIDPSVLRIAHRSLLTTGFRKDVIGIEIFSRGWDEDFCPMTVVLEVSYKAVKMYSNSGMVESIPYRLAQAYSHLRNCAGWLIGRNHRWCLVLQDGPSCRMNRIHLCTLLYSSEPTLPMAGLKVVRSHRPEYLSVCSCSHDIRSHPGLTFVLWERIRPSVLRRSRMA